MPICVCQVFKAAKGDKVAHERLVEAMAYNASYGAFTLIPCQHTPRCAPLPEDLREAYQTKVALDVEAYMEAHPPKRRPSGG